MRVSKRGYRLAVLMWGHSEEEEMNRKTLSYGGPHSHTHPGFQKPCCFFFSPPASSELLCHYYKTACESFCFVEVTLLHLDSTTVSTQQQRAEPSIRLSLTDITHLITAKLKENMQRGYCLSFFFKSQTWINCLTLHQTCLNRPVSLEEKDRCKMGKA